MPELDNDTRINRAIAAIYEHKNYMGRDSHSEIFDENVIDLLADLRHYSKQQDLNFDRLVAMSEMHFEAETEDS